MELVRNSVRNNTVNPVRSGAISRPENKRLTSNGAKGTRTSNGV